MINFQTFLKVHFTFVAKNFFLISLSLLQKNETAKPEKNIEICKKTTKFNCNSLKKILRKNIVYRQD